MRSKVEVMSIAEMTGMAMLPSTDCCIPGMSALVGSGLGMRVWPVGVRVENCVVTTLLPAPL